MQSRDIKLVIRPWIPDWVMQYKVTIQFYETDYKNNHVLTREVKNVKCVYNDFQTIDYSSSRGSRETGASIEIYTKFDPGSYSDELRIIFEDKKVGKNNYKVDDVERVHDMNGTYYYTKFRGH